LVSARAFPIEINEAMRRTASIHHLHFGTAYGAGCRTIMGLLRGAFALFPDFSARRPVKKYAPRAALFLDRRLPHHFGHRCCRRAQLHHAAVC